MSDSAPRHPEVRTMVAFIEGRLAPDELEAVSEHLRGCRDCRAVVIETARFEQEQEDRPARPPRMAWWWLAAAAAAIAAIVVVLPLFRRETPPLARLIAAAPREHRLVEPRLSGFPWARLRAPSRGEAPVDPADLRLAGAAGDVLERTAGRGHDAGVAYLLIGRAHESIAALEQAANRSNGARPWNDLAAARYAAAMQDERPSQLVQALADVDRALHIDPGLAEARFNRALILERIGVREKAREAWQQFLEVDSTSGWAVEARAHLRALGAQSKKFDPALLDRPAPELVHRFPQEARKYGEGPILCGWANGDSRALPRVRAIADALAAFNGEQLLGDAVAAIERAGDADRAALVEGYRVYCDARRAYGQRHGADAEKQLRRAAGLFARGRSPMAEVARYYAASAVFDQNRGAEARQQLLEIRARIDAARYRALSAQIGWTLAVVANSAGDADTGAREAGAAAAIFRSLGERTNEAFVEGIAAHALERLGEHDAAWNRRIRTLETHCGGDDRARCNGILAEAAAQLIAIDRPDRALALIGATVDGRDGEPFGEATALVRRARVAVRAGGDAAARDALARARTAALRIPDEALRETTEAQIAVEEAALTRASDPRGAIDVLSRSAAFLASHDVDYLLPYVHLQRARAFRAAGDEERALSDYRAALREVEQQRNRITDPALRLAFLDTARQVVDETIALHLSRGEVQEAFRVSDARRRSRSGTAAQLPARAAAIEYAVLPHGLAIFCVTGEGITAHRLAIERRELESRVDALVSAIRRRAAIGDVHAASSALYALLIAPVRARLESFEELVIVPDAQLFAVPFAALYDGERYLMEDFDIRFAMAVPSLPAAGGDALAPALVVGDPPASRPRLRAGRGEAAEVASLYRGVLLAGDAATRDGFMEAARRSGFIYFAGHAESDARASNAALLLADGPLAESDITAMRLERQPLVVLAACGTFRGDPMHVAGMPSLARAFLMAGARAVVGTLWEIEDDVAAAFFLRFNESLRIGVPPVRALRDAQRAMSHSSDPRLGHPATWAPMQLLSGAV